MSNTYTVTLTAPDGTVLRQRTYLDRWAVDPELLGHQMLEGIDNHVDATKDEDDDD